MGVNGQDLPAHRRALGEWLKTAREAAGYTQASAAQALNSTVTSESRWETGRHPITVEDFFARVLLYDAFETLAPLLRRWPVLLDATSSLPRAPLKQLARGQADDRAAHGKKRRTGS